MKQASSLLRVFSALFFAFSLQIAQAQITAGKDYVAVSPPQATETGDKVEVLEVFSYMCSHCYQFEPKLAAWAKAQPADVSVRKLPVSFNREAWASVSRIYYTLEAMGELGRLHGKVFDAIHAENLKMENPEVAADWATRNGLDRKKFTDTMNSFTVQSKVGRLPQITRNYGVESVPTMIVDGKYKIIGATSYDDLLRIASELVQLARSQRPAKAAAVAAPAPVAKPAAESAKKASTK